MRTFTLFLLSLAGIINAQTQPAIKAWLQNTTLKGSYYTSGQSTAITNNIVANVQSVKYATNFVYIGTNGVPTYPTGPFLDNNPSVTTSQNAIFKFPLNPTPATTPTSTTGGNIGLFINGVALFDYRDGISWRNSTNSLAGGPLGGAGDAVWNRDAIVAERSGFDCSKGHPAMGNYHHHQNPTAFKLSTTVLSSICNLYDAEGLYAINTANHSPLIGFAYDGYPIYGAYGYKNADGTGGIIRIKSSYQLRNITTRTTYFNGTTVTAGPVVSATYPLGYFREDYEFVSHPNETDYLDVHNGRFAVTPEYPNGTYAYYATVDANLNSAYPYVVGPTFYGVKNAVKVTSITEAVTTYLPVVANDAAEEPAKLDISVYPNPTSESIIFQAENLVEDNLTIQLYDLMGRLLLQTQIRQGSTIASFDVQKLYAGTYLLKITDGKRHITKKITINKI